MRILMIACLFCVSSMASESLEDLIKKLEHEEFDVREEASEALVRDFPAEKVEEYLVLARCRKDDLEVHTRLINAANELFLRKVIPTTIEYRYIIGDIGFTWSPQYDSYIVYSDSYYPSEISKQIGLCVNFLFLYGPADDKLKKWDVITAINGEKYTQFTSNSMCRWGECEAGKEYTITVRRYKNIEQIQERGIVLPDEDKEYEELTLKIIATKKENLRMDELERIKRLEDDLWSKVLVNVWGYSSGKSDTLD